MAEAHRGFLSVWGPPGVLGCWKTGASAATGPLAASWAIIRPEVSTFQNKAANLKDLHHGMREGNPRGSPTSEGAVGQVGAKLWSRQILGGS